MSKWKRAEKYPDGVPITPQVTTYRTVYELECRVCGPLYSTDRLDIAQMWQRSHDENHREKHVEALRKEGSLG